MLRGKCEFENEINPLFLFVCWFFSERMAHGNLALATFFFFSPRNFNTRHDQQQQTFGKGSNERKELGINVKETRKREGVPSLSEPPRFLVSEF